MGGQILGGLNNRINVAWDIVFYELTLGEVPAWLMYVPGFFTLLHG